MLLTITRQKKPAAKGKPIFTNIDMLPPEFFQVKWRNHKTKPNIKYLESLDIIAEPADVSDVQIIIPSYIGENRII